MSDKTIKDAVEYFGGVWPYDSEVFGVGFSYTHGWSRCRLDSSYLVCTKQQFEDYVTTEQEEKPMTKYKSVPVTGLTIWQLGQAVNEGCEFYDRKGKKIYEEVGFKLETMFFDHESIVKQLKKGLITTREPIMWYDELPKLVWFDGGVFLAKKYDESKMSSINLGFDWVMRQDCTPLTREEAAEYGVAGNIHGNPELLA